MPGSPPRRISDPGTRPPPSTRFSSPMPVSMRSMSRSRISFTRCASARGMPGRRIAAVDGSFAATCSAKVFHSPHAGQRPSHLGDS